MINYTVIDATNLICQFDWKGDRFGWADIGLVSLIFSAILPALPYRDSVGFFCESESDFSQLNLLILSKPK
jgi:hypothetical protein